MKLTLADLNRRDKRESTKPNNNGPIEKNVLSTPFAVGKSARIAKSVRTAGH